MDFRNFLFSTSDYSYNTFLNLNFKNKIKIVSNKLKQIFEKFEKFKCL